MSTNLWVIEMLPALCHLITDQLADVLDNHGVFLKVLGSEQAEALDARPPQVHVSSPLSLEEAGGEKGVKIVKSWNKLENPVIELETEFPYLIIQVYPSTFKIVFQT